MTNSAITGVGVSRKEQIALFNTTVVGFFKTVDKASKLAHDHLTFEIRNHREHIVLLPNTRRHRRPENNGVHLVTRVHHRVFNDIQRNGINVFTL